MTPPPSASAATEDSPAAAPPTPPPDSTLYIIDGHAQIFRAYFAIRTAMTSPVTGEPTHAVFGFAAMLLKLFRQCRPKYVVVAIDTAGPTFRDALYSEYKANREAPPEDLHQQEQRIVEMCRLFGVPVLAEEGAEADDTIASLVKRMLAEEDELRIRIVSKDKDLQQLLADRVSLFDIHTDQELTLERLKREKQITPEQVVDVLALAGDSVDNIVGVKGVGEKTAVKLIAEFESIDGILENLDRIKGKRRENLEEARDRLAMNRKLVMLKDDLELDFTLEHSRMRRIHADELKQLFRTLGFNRHLGDLEALLKDPSFDWEIVSEPERGATGGGEARANKAVSGEESGNDSLAGSDGPDGADAEPGFDGGLFTSPVSKPEAFVDPRYRSITDRSELEELAGRLSTTDTFAFDTETIGLGHDTELCGLSFCFEDDTAAYVPVKLPEGETSLDRQTVLSTLQDVLESETITKVGHNIKYDLLVLRRAGVELGGPLFDTMVAAYLTNQPGLGMDALALSLFGHQTIAITDLIGRKQRGRTQKTMDQVPLEQIGPYAAEDALITWKLHERFREMLREEQLERLAYETEMPLVRVLCDMESYGIRVDSEVLERQRKKLSAQAERLKHQILDAAGIDFNPDSPKQLAEVLFTEMKLPVQKRLKTGPSTNMEVRQQLSEHESLSDEQKRVPRLIVEYRQLTKLVGTYLVALREAIREDTGRIHASFNQTITATGRLSSSGPNLQNVPIRTELGRQIREAFVADPGSVLLSADYSQIELRMLAHLSEDEALLDAFTRGQDVHTAVAMEVFGLDSPEEVTSEIRTQAKTINFGIVYGVTAFGLARRIEGLDRAAAEELIESYKSRFSGINAFLQQCVDHAKEHGYVSTILGRRRAIDEIQAKAPQRRALGERLAINTVVQGSAADLIKVAMVRLHRRIREEGLPLKMLLQIHDELVFETPEGRSEAMRPIVVGEMEQAMTLKVPLQVETGSGVNWLEAK